MRVPKWIPVNAKNERVERDRAVGYVMDEETKPKHAGNRISDPRTSEPIETINTVNKSSPVPHQQAEKSNSRNGTGKP